VNEKSSSTWTVSSEAAFAVSAISRLPFLLPSYALTIIKIRHFRGQCQRERRNSWHLRWSDFLLILSITRRVIFGLRWLPFSVVPTGSSE
jgi:hypothetical protein